MNTNPIWNECLSRLKTVLPEDDINTWLLPLHIQVSGQTLKLLAPNRYVLNYVKLHLITQVTTTISEIDTHISEVRCEIGGYHTNDSPAISKQSYAGETDPKPYSGGHINREFNFSNHVEGISNQLARAAAQQVGLHPGMSYNPLFIYGGVGLGKTHLMQAAGNLILENKPSAKVIYIRSELFVNDMVKALKTNTMNEFKRHYRSLDALLIDDIQFFARKTQSQEEFFHTFNSLLEGQRQIVITSDRIPKAMTDVEERLISRFGSGLTVSVDPPELETRVAILCKKALNRDIVLPEDVAFFIANTVRSNVRDLQGALRFAECYQY